MSNYVKLLHIFNENCQFISHPSPLDPPHPSRVHRYTHPSVRHYIYQQFIAQREEICSIGVTDRLKKVMLNLVQHLIFFF